MKENEVVDLFVEKLELAENEVYKFIFGEQRSQTDEENRLWYDLYGEIKNKRVNTIQDLIFYRLVASRDVIQDSFPYMTVKPVSDNNLHIWIPVFNRRNGFMLAPIL